MKALRPLLISEDYPPDMVDRFIVGTEKGELGICYQRTDRADTGIELTDLTVHIYIQV